MKGSFTNADRANIYHMKAYKIQFATTKPRYFRHLLDAVKAAGMEAKYQAIRRKLIKEIGACEFEGCVFERIEIE